jgi:vitamin B12 transporter
MKKRFIVLPLALCLSLFFDATGVGRHNCFSANAFADEITTLDEIVVTGSRSAAKLRNVASTIQIFDKEQIRRSPAPSITEFLSENGVAFFSQWSPGQTSISLRGVRSDGQGRDFKGGVLVLINGRRAGTANLSKLSTNQVNRIEIIRGPASVSYGSQAMGGVINLITRNGINTQGGSLTAQGGSFGYIKGSVEDAGKLTDTLSGYVGVNGEARNDYDGGRDSSKQKNTAYERYGALAALNWESVSGSGLDITVRTDGVYRAGFRGSSYDIDNDEDRYNQSVDLHYNIDLPSLNAVWESQAYMFKDVDNFRWGSEASGYDVDNIRREQKGYGLKMAPLFSLTNSTDLVVGFDAEYSELRSDRYRYGISGPKPQTAPYDINQDSLVLAGFAELNQRLLNDRMNLQMGVRYTHNKLSLVDTPFKAINGDSDVTNSHVTYSTGVCYSLLDNVKIRTSYSTGFRTPTGSELTGEYTPVLSPNSITRGNSDLDPETNRQFEVGLTYTSKNSFWDIALFDNCIEDRIGTKTIFNDGTTKISQYRNISGDARIKGVELLGQYNFAPILKMKDQNLKLLVNASYNFTMDENGKESLDSGPNAEKIQRMPEYQGSMTATYGWKQKWDISLISTLNGPMYYDTEEKLTSTAQDASDYVHKKNSFTIFNLRTNYRLRDNVRLFAGINNLFDKNYHPMFIQIDDGTCRVDPAKTNGGCGNSLPGRNFYIGMNVSF